MKMSISQAFSLLFLFISSSSFHFAAATFVTPLGGGIIASNIITDAAARILHHPRRRPTKYYHRHRPSSTASQFLYAHNVVRSYHKLKPLKWSRSLARYARRWAYSRAGDCQLIHSPNSPYGENMFWGLNSHWTPNDVVRVWASEHRNYNMKTNECVGKNSICGHYTQIIWRKTRFLGCGRVACDANKGFLFVCAYDPPGNFYFEGPLGGHFSKSIVYPPPGAVF